MGRYFRILDSELPLHITARCNNKEDFPVSLSEAWQLFSDYLFMLHFFYKIKIHSFVMMSNHFHLIVSDPELNLPKAMSVFMRETSKEMSRMSFRINRVWGAPYHSCVITDPRHFLCTYKYNYRNPVAAKIVSKVEEYPWSTLQILLGNMHGIFPIVEDETFINDPNGTLTWLNESYKEEEIEVIHKAIQKKTFKITRDPKSGRKVII